MAKAKNKDNYIAAIKAYSKVQNLTLHVDHKNITVLKFFKLYIKKITLN